MHHPDGLVSVASMLGLVFVVVGLGPGFALRMTFMEHQRPLAANQRISVGSHYLTTPACWLPVSFLGGSFDQLTVAVLVVQ